MVFRIVVAAQIWRHACRSPLALRKDGSNPFVGFEKLRRL
jgi:hypothetical protein